MKNKWICGASATLLMLACVMGSRFSTSAETRPRAETQAFMRLKSVWSQGILDGLTLEKFDEVSRNAVRLRDMTQSNLWYVARQPDYMRHTTNFQQSVDALYMGAVDKKLDVATEAYLNVIKNCVACHRLVRTDQRKQAAGDR
jgi:hypothetical protein